MGQKVYLNKTSPQKQCLKTQTVSITLSNTINVKQNKTTEPQMAGRCRQYGLSVQLFVTAKSQPQVKYYSSIIEGRSLQLIRDVRNQQLRVPPLPRLQASV